MTSASLLTVRNWNSPGPTLPQVYPRTYLNTDSTSLWPADAFTPNLVSICLGTNDFSDDDGSYRRAPLDSALFVNEYIRFVHMVRNRFPDASIVCLSSPMLAKKKNNRLINYLGVIINHLHTLDKDDKIHLFTFRRIYNNGCFNHPDRKEHQQMAHELVPFFKKIMGW